MPFFRRFTSFPAIETLTSVSGVVVIDGTSPASVQGLNQGFVALAGEFADVSSGVSVSASGVVSTNPQWTEVFTSQELLDLTGGFDETIGQFGGDFGNGFAWLFGKRFSRLAVCAINTASANAVRMYRELPTNTSATDTTPVVPLVAAVVPAGFEFKTSTNRVRSRKKVTFTDAAPRAQGTDGAVTAAGSPAATQTFNAASGNFVNNGVLEGDGLALGIVGTGSGGTYRIVSVAATSLVVEKQDGSSFDWTTASSQPWRVHPASAHDTGANHQLSEAAGYLIPAQPLDATIAISTQLSPTVAASAGTATTWDALSGLKMAIQPAGALTFTSAVQSANAANASAIDTLYGSVIDAALINADPMKQFGIICAARMSDTIRAKLKQHVQSASAIGRGRRTFIGPELDVVSVSTWLGDSAPGVGAQRDERVNYVLPGLRVQIPDAVGFTINLANGLTTTDGNIEVPGAGWAAVLRSNLAPEQSIGMLQPPVPFLLSPILDLQTGLPTLTMSHYAQFKAKGIMAWEKDLETEARFDIESAVTTSLTSGRTAENRRSMADFIQDSIAAFMKPYKDVVLSDNQKESLAGAIDSFLGGLLSPTNAEAQRIAAYTIDMESGNTAALSAAGVFVVCVTVEMLSVASVIVLNSKVGLGLLSVEAA